MKKQITLCDVPTNSQLSTVLKDAYFYDAHQFSTRFSNKSALEIWLAHANATPAWINALMTTRNKVASLLGLKDLGKLADKINEKSADTYQVGDRVGIFTLLFLSDNEVILADSDKHLDVKLSVYKAGNHSDDVTISTVVHVHNFLGKAYMLFVEPMHKLIVPATIKKAEC